MKVSVIVTTFNHSEFIRDCLDNIINQQTSFDFELLIGEDESTDSTREICLEYENKYPNIVRCFFRSRNDVIYIDNKPTGRFNFIETLSAAKGQYIALCEGDDYWSDVHKLQKQIDFLDQNKEYSICFHPVDIISDTGEYKKTTNQQTRETTGFSDLINGNYIYTPSVVIRRSSIPDELPDYMYKIPMGDWGLYLLAANVGKIKLLDKVMACYRIHEGGIWGGKHLRHRLKNTIKALDMMETEFDSKWRKSFKNASCQFIRSLANTYPSYHYLHYLYHLKARI